MLQDIYHCNSLEEAKQKQTDLLDYLKENSTLIYNKYKKVADATLQFYNLDRGLYNPHTMITLLRF